MQAKLREHALSSSEARARALRPTASAGVGRADVLQRYGPSHSDEEGAPRRLVVASAAFRWHRRAGATIRLRVRGARGVERAALTVAS